MSLQQIKFKVGQAVFAKVKGYVSWPSIILEINKGTAKVAFFNSNQHAYLGFKKLMLVSESDALIKRHLNKHLEFTKAYNEMLIVVNAKKKEQHLRPVLKIRLLIIDEIEDIKKKLRNFGQSKKKLRFGRCY